MDPSSSVVRSGVTSVPTIARPTPAPQRVSFNAVLSASGKGLVSTANLAAGFLPGGPMVATAIRSSSGSITGAVSSNPSAGGPGGNFTAEGGASAAAAPAQGSVESSLQQSQEMNLYYLQIQEAVNAQNRSFTTLSNVLKAEHETVKTAIGNIR